MQRVPYQRTIFVQPIDGPVLTDEVVIADAILRLGFLHFGPRMSRLATVYQDANGHHYSDAEAVAGSSNVLSLATLSAAAFFSTSSSSPVSPPKSGSAAGACSCGAITAARSSLSPNTTCSILSLSNIASWLVSMPNRLAMSLSCAGPS